MLIFRMKTLKLILTATTCLALSASCVQQKDATADNSKIDLIMETDIGNDVDDALAMDLLYKYLDEDRINLLAVCINKEGTAPAEFTDIMNTWYGYPDIPIGIVKNGADCEDDAVNYAKAVVNIKDNDGNPLYQRTLTSYENLPEATTVYRRILSKAKDNSITIASVGFSTNLVRLLASEPDDFSPLSGKELVAKKVKVLVTMAGNFRDSTFHEYNVVRDIPAAKVIFEQWPTPVVTSPWELGDMVRYPGESIENDFKWAENHPLIDAYEAYLPMPYDRPTWDPTAVLYAVEGGDMFNVSPNGTIRVNDKGATIFTPDANGNRQYITVDSTQAKAMKEYFIQRITSVPKCKQ